MSEITLLLERINGGSQAAFDELVPLVYEELRRQARRCLSGRRGNETLQPTELVHEAFLKLLGRGTDWQGSRHFYNAAAQVMRQVLVTQARTNSAKKRGNPRLRVELEDLPEQGHKEELDWEAMDTALGELQRRDQRRYQVVMLRYFCGLTDAQTAQALDVSEKTVERDWATAKAFLRSRMEPTDD